MIEKFKETTIVVDGFVLHVYTSTFFPIRPFWHTPLTAIYVYLIFKDYIDITLKEALHVIIMAKNTKKEFRFKKK